MVNNAPKIPVSQLLASKSATDDDEPKKKTKDDWRKQKELEENRKAGTAPAEVDEDGRDINPHIPQYISAAPWYYGTLDPTLRHQRPQEDKQQEYSGIDDWYKRGVDRSKTATKYRKGACENCGAMTHTKRDCMERPRKVGAKFAETAIIAHDEFIQPDLKPSYDGKRDRWAGYDPANHSEIVEEYQKIEDAKRQMRADKLQENPNADESDEEEEDGDKYADEIDMPGTKVDSKQRITVRNLRIREDTAKYLRNLDPNSAYYDPKTRSMRDNPNPKTNPEETEFAGENFVRYTGDTQKHAQAQLFAWEAHGKGVDVHVLAEPTKLELLQKEYDKKKEEFKDNVKDGVYERYGGKEHHLNVPSKALLMAQTETYIEYSRDGRIIKGVEKPKILSRFEEDVLINNHQSVFGSYWNNGCWGYKCCYSMIRNSYCVGESGKSLDIPHVGVQVNAPESEEQEVREESSAESSEEEKSRKSKKSKKSKKKKQKKKQKELKKMDKLQLALQAEDEHNEKVKQMMSIDERKRPYNSMFEHKEPTEEQMEAFMIKRPREEDPMLQFVDK